VPPETCCVSTSGLGCDFTAPEIGGSILSDTPVDDRDICGITGLSRENSPPSPGGSGGSGIPTTSGGVGGFPEPPVTCGGSAAKGTPPILGGVTGSLTGACAAFLSGEAPRDSFGFVAFPIPTSSFCVDSFAGVPCTSGSSFLFFFLVFCGVAFSETGFVIFSGVTGATVSIGRSGGFTCSGGIACSGGFTSPGGVTLKDGSICSGSEIVCPSLLLKDWPLFLEILSMSAGAISLALLMATEYFPERRTSSDSLCPDVVLKYSSDTSLALSTFLAISCSCSGVTFSSSSVSGRAPPLAFPVFITSATPWRRLMAASVTLPAPSKLRPSSLNPPIMAASTFSPASLCIRA